MNVILKEKKKMSLKRKILYIAVIVICIIAILVGSYIQVFKSDNGTGKKKYVELSNEQYTRLESEFETIFKNNMNQNGNFDLSKIIKQKEDEELIINGYVNTDEQTNNYKLNVNIPYINIDSPIIEKYNDEIKSIFQQKALDIIDAGANTNAIYSVEYTAYINNNILSLAIRSTLKENNNAQRIIIQTYNYNLEKNKIATIDNLLEIKGISSNYAESKVREKIKESQAKVEDLKQLGYTIFERDYKSEIYKMKNTTEYFLGDNGCLYLIYAYGNNNYTDEMDLIVF